MKIAAVTGATGMIGSYVVRKLLNHGWYVRALSRKKNMLPQSVETIIGDLESDSDLHTLVSGVDIAIHCAAELHDESLMIPINTDATRNLGRIALDEGVDSFVYLSSAGVVGPVSDEWIDESTPCRPSNAYEQSKWQAENDLQQLSAKMRICMLRPTNVVDEQAPGIVRVGMSLSLKGRLSLMLKGAERAHLVHASDVADAAVFLAENGACTGVYLVGCDEDERNTMAGVVNMVRLELNQPAYTGSVMPVAVPYCLRKAMRGASLHGRSRFSSARFRQAGFEPRLGLTGAIKRLCRDGILK